MRILYPGPLRSWKPFQPELPILSDAGCGFCGKLWVSVFVGVFYVVLFVPYLHYWNVHSDAIRMIVRTNCGMNVANLKEKYQSDLHLKINVKP